MVSKPGVLSTDSRSIDQIADVWGLTGGVAAGKSLAARYFNEAGIPVFDADRIARELSAPGGAAHAAILQRFGTDDRARLREIAFGDEGARRDLEAILHPLIRAESFRRVRDFAAAWKQTGRPKVVYEAALLVETGRDKDLKGLIVVDAPREQRLKRLIERDRCRPELAEKILAAQLGDRARLSAATHVLDNSGSPDDLRRRVLELIPLL